MKTAFFKVIAINVCLLFMSMNGLSEEKPLPSTVVKLVGDARWSNDDGKTWKPLKVGQKLESRLVIQTATFGRAYILLGEDVHSLIENSHAGGALFDPEQYPENLIGLLDNSALDLISVRHEANTRKTPPVEQTELKLRGGTMLANVKQLSTNSLFLIRCSTNAALKMQSAVAQIAATGDFVVFKGTVNVSLLEKQFTTNVVALQRFDAMTMTATNFDSPYNNWKHDIWLPSDPVYENWARQPKR